MCLWFQLTRHTELCLKENKEESKTTNVFKEELGCRRVMSTKVNI